MDNLRKESYHSRDIEALREWWAGWAARLGAHQAGCQLRGLFDSKKPISVRGREGGVRNITSAHLKIQDKKIP